MRIAGLFLIFSLLLQTCIAMISNNLATCGYSTQDYTSPLVFGNKEEQVGEVTVTIEATKVTVSYSLSREGCFFTDSLHVNVVNTPLDRIKPGRFPCKEPVTDGGSTAEIECEAEDFQHINCCDNLIIYTHAVMQCEGSTDTETLFGGPDDNECSSNRRRWCRYFDIEPPCGQCGCSEEKNMCIPTVQCNTLCDTSTVCDMSECITPTPCTTCVSDKAESCPGDPCVTPGPCPECTDNQPAVCPSDLGSCATPEPCPNCLTDKAEKCPGEDCVTPVPCPECTDNQPAVCPSDLGSCATPEPCPNCLTDKAEKCPGEDCVTPVPCPECTDNQPAVCPSDLGSCATPEPCPNCLTDKAEKCPGEDCVTPVPCPECTDNQPAVCPSDLGSCATPEPCPNCLTDKAEKCPGEDCVTPGPCPECTDDQDPVCPSELSSCVTPVPCTTCQSVLPEVCLGSGTVCKTPPPCPNCFIPNGDCSDCIPNPEVDDTCNPCVDIENPDGTVISGNKFCELFAGLSNSFKCCPPSSQCKSGVIPTRSGLPETSREVSFICSTSCGDKCDGKTSEACSLFGVLPLNNDGMDDTDDVFETCPDTSTTILPP